MTTIDRRRRGRRDQDKAREHYLAALSHELRTPLGGVLGLAELLEGTRLDAEQQAYVAGVRDCGRHLLSLVNDVLDMARIDAGRLELQPAPTDLEDLLRGVAELLSPRAHGKGLEIAWAATGLSDIRGGGVLVDAGRLRQILFNLGGNAVKFTEAGGVLLSCAASASAAGGIRLRFTVADTGPGVAKAEQAMIFEPFAQGLGAQGPGGQPVAESTGLGLAVVERLVRAMDGRLGIDSTEGEGAQFWFEIHAKPAVIERADAPDLSGVTVTVASPNPMVRRAARMQLEASGGGVHESLSAVEATGAGEGPVLIDLACEDAAPVPGRPSLVLLRPEDRGKIPACLKAGYAGYLIKPLRRVSLATRVLAALGGPASRGGTARHAPDDERAAPARTRGFHVLLAEDDPVNALLARTLLAREGCEVRHAHTGTEAVEAAASQGFDLILMDRRLPGIDGLEAARRLRAAGIATPIAALTADAYEEDRRACLAAGMDAFLAKPLDGAVLRALLAQVGAGAFTPGAETAKLAS